MTVRNSNYAVIGSGAREHAIVSKLKKDNPSSNVYCIPGNGGIPGSCNLDISDFSVLENFCHENNIEIIIPGSELYLEKGIKDYFSGKDIKVFGPSKTAAKLESSKIFAKNFMHRYNVASPGYKSFSASDNFEEVLDYLQTLNWEAVIKYDGLAAGKGVFVVSGKEECINALEAVKKNFGVNAEFLIEEKLNGTELSIIGVTDGEYIRFFSPSQDHKRLLDNDEGPNTGGMGAYTPVKFCTEELLKRIENKIISPTIKGLKSEGFDYKGFIYFGIMISDNEPYLLEYNVRLGDPETEVLLPALRTSLQDIITSTFSGTLSEIQIQFNPGYFICLVLASKGYPTNPEKGFEIKGLDKISKDIEVFHAGTEKKEGKYFTAGGRVLMLTAGASDFNEALTKIYNAVSAIEFNGMHFRKDIGFKNK